MGASIPCSLCPCWLRVGCPVQGRPTAERCRVDRAPHRVTHMVRSLSTRREKGRGRGSQPSFCSANICLRAFQSLRPWKHFVRLCWSVLLGTGHQGSTSEDLGATWSKPHAHHPDFQRIEQRARSIPCELATVFFLRIDLRCFARALCNLALDSKVCTCDPKLQLPRCEA